MRQHNNLIIGAIADLLIGMVRWSQMLPMIVVGGGLLLILLVMTATNFQGEVLAMASLAEPIVLWLDRLPFIDIQGWVESMADEDGSIRFGGNDLKAAAGKIYLYGSIFFFAIAALIDWLFGPFPRWSYGRKLKLVTLLAAAACAGFFANYFFGSEQFNGGLGSWAVLFILFPTIWIIVSAYSLGVSHLLSHVSDMIRGERQDDTR